MRPRLSLLLLVLTLAAGFAFAQRPKSEDRDTLPNGKSRKLEIIKQDHEKSLEDVAAIIAIARELEMQMERNTEHVVSIDALRKAEEIESLSKRLQKRMKRVY